MKWRKLLFFLSAPVLFALYLWGAFGLPPLEVYRGPYGDIVNSIGEYRTHATEMVAVVNFDFRSFDTLIEEFILFASVAGVVLLLRKQPKEDYEPQADSVPDRDVPEPGEAVRWWSLLLAGPTVAYGIYVVLHGHLTPGGGFQGGVILASVPLIVYLSSEYGVLQKITSHHWTEVAEAFGAGAFLLIGWISLALGLPFLQDYLGRGQTGDLVSGGIIPLISGAAGIEVTAGLLLIIIIYLELVMLLSAEEKKKRGRR